MCTAATYYAKDHYFGRNLDLEFFLCLIEKKTYLRENLIALPIEYI